MRRWAAGIPLAFLVAASACTSGEQGDSAAISRLTGAGATFPNPIYTRWFDEYNRTTGLQINYQSIGSGGGIRQFTEGTVDFGATDGPMKDDQIASVGGNVLHIPTVIGAVVLTYNLPSLGDTRLTLDGQTTSEIFLGRIPRWNDRRITALNPDVNLPDAEIVVVHRSDGSGTSFIFTDFLSKVSADWMTEVGAGKSLKWPTGIGAKGNEGVTQQVKQLEGSIGYVELIYALSNQLAYAAVMNSGGEAVVPSLTSASAAAAGVNWTADTDFRVSITDASGPGAYPIASFTWLLIKQDNPEPAKGAVIKEFLTWMVSPAAQDIASELGYAPLPGPVVELVSDRIGGLEVQGQAIAG
jgi:phosphate transport system substrate-binding protein